jgi:hypothetical protein
MALSYPSESNSRSAIPNEPRAELEPATKSLENDLFPFKAPGARGAGGLHRSAAIKEQLDVTCAQG